MQEETLLRVSHGVVPLMLEMVLWAIPNSSPMGREGFERWQGRASLLLLHIAHGVGPHCDEGWGLQGLFQTCPRLAGLHCPAKMSLLLFAFSFASESSHCSLLLKQLLCITQVLLVS